MYSNNRKGYNKFAWNCITVVRDDNRYYHFFLDPKGKLIFKFPREKSRKILDEIMKINNKSSPEEKIKKSTDESLKPSEESSPPINVKKKVDNEFGALYEELTSSNVFNNTGQDDYVDDNDIYIENI